MTVRHFSSVLVANRGEIARRVFRTARGMGLRCVGVFAPADSDAPFVAEADEAVRLETGYLDAEAVIDAARRSGAEAVHPGYGFLSENAAFAAAVAHAGLVWVGPPPAVIEAMGDKLAAKRAAVDAGVPTLPAVDDPAAADEIGYPLLVKAAAGGGGKGMRLVTAADDLDDAVAAARREARSSFGDDRVFLERYVARSRHVEIQVLGDRHGRLVHLGERECSIQRRHQKVVEESPSPVVDDAMRQAMGAVALDLARAIAYESAGTVEFLVDDETRDFYFLEVNTRLQVEHPVTELVTGIDLVREQLRIAAGEPLGYDQAAVRFRGHAIEARLYAEDPAAGFLPATGTLAAFTPPAEPDVRWDSGVEAGTVVGVEFDPMLAKVIAWAPSRSDAAGRLARSLERLHLGGVVTNREFLAATLRHPAFLSGDTTTDFIERVGVPTGRPVDEDALRQAAVAGALWIQGRNRAAATVLGSAPSGWRNARLPAQRVVFDHGDRRAEVAYDRRRDGSFALGDGATARVHSWSEAAVDVELDGRRWASLVTAAGDRLHVQMPWGSIDLDIVPRFAVPGADVRHSGGFVAPMPGVVLEVRCRPGDHVTAGATLVVLEAMKMEHHLRAPADGVVTEVRVTAGEQVENGAVLLVFEESGGHDGG